MIIAYIISIIVTVLLAISTKNLYTVNGNTMMLVCYIFSIIATIISAYWLIRDSLEYLYKYNLPELEATKSNEVFKLNFLFSEKTRDLSNKERQEYWNVNIEPSFYALENRFKPTFQNVVLKRYNK